ncbi:bifunctional UDP-N-acetylmuramoyl-L-alanyl-D-glutamate--2,6-diaminopimelate ligase MurE/UDP-N-acetylmuramoyl-tripeptide--D-alanyl-D-alanine ligase MurF [Verticiella sediminum]|uniref:Multifunctional fusion protein n=1 Tax=Verticiella sediminum TaxID=1247510 RepID=A0A556A8C4_9BURK|nr:bifunctional UDP-N-acetylmuramoyl-L-alanyl-D-glutamate--2,6-diaminopimelate ligase MurE/UDP-N-acetylmuramoyl-tripeptide--D-alanyl-D-alanine ligase MurF [Verticiella sediminum]TSH89137.1 bifunctional UDP-N-acetylmuramoyl-L-alanyl-D-glutamate--2,6-diaminopimelate ligase MurE/UDP-N-acetylmuramoyl-tripeptide--D-alanyl-D-alanine ligase MurF [Verticiella sediminum]
MRRVLDWLRARVDAGAELHLDSRRVRRGDVFLACPGAARDGRDFALQAATAGAAAVLFEADDAPPGLQARIEAGGAQALAVAGLRGQLGTLADAWYGEPSRALTVIAVTGTNGKTSTTRWIAQALNAHGTPCGVVGTLGAVLPDGESLEVGLTTPDVVSLHGLLARMRRAGAQAVAMEASSIGLAQDRMDAVRVRVAGFTNLTRDHLDAHGDMATYEAAKARLFAWPGLDTAVINLADPAGARMASSTVAKRVIGWRVGGAAPTDAAAPAAALWADGLAATSDGNLFTLCGEDGARALIHTALLGTYNVENLLLVAGVLRALGWPLARIAQALGAFEPVPGRLQTVTMPGSAGPLVLVDYAHTPDALANVLRAVRPLADARGGRLVCLFGCGGDRDPGKRGPMAVAAREAADAIVVTSDNPRSEAPLAIIDDVLAGLRASRDAVPPGVTVQLERARAILDAIWRSMPADVVVLAGKGHETTQEVAGVKSPFSDAEWARLALALPAASGVTTDTRSIGPGEIFVALKGERFDGHAFLEQAAAAGAGAAVVEAPQAAGLPTIALGDTRQALARMAAAWRARYTLPLIGVTGSNGKTTTKEMIAAILAAWLGSEHVLATRGNLNNDIGVPLTLLRLGPAHRAAVVELGMNHPGEIAGLAAMAAPTVALVNNAQREHQEFMQSVEAVAHENGAVLAALPADGVAVYPGDEPYAPIWDALSGARARMRFGLSGEVEVGAADIWVGDEGSRFLLCTPMGQAQLALQVAGRHNLRNALAAAACALAAGCPLAAVVRGLVGFLPVKGRLQGQRLPGGLWLIDDTYNANPDSVRAAIDVLAGAAGPRALVLGDMGEVGDQGPAMHREVGEYARARGVDTLIGMGAAAFDAVAAFGAGSFHVGSPEEAVAILQAAPPAVVLVKGSRFMRMERVVVALQASPLNGVERGADHAA